MATRERVVGVEQARHAAHDVVGFRVREAGVVAAVAASLRIIP
jgi:hypothetical protein